MWASSTIWLVLSESRHKCLFTELCLGRTDMSCMLAYGLYCPPMKGFEPTVPRKQQRRVESCFNIIDGQVGTLADSRNLGECLPLQNDVLMISFRPSLVMEVTNILYLSKHNKALSRIYQSCLSFHSSSSVNKMKTLTAWDKCKSIIKPK